VVITGTDTGVGKTVVTAALAATATAAGRRVAVVKAAQTGIPARPPSGGAAGSRPATADAAESDGAVVARLGAPATVRTLAEYPDPLAPLAAARVAGLEPLPMADVVDAVAELAGEHDLVLIEGAGGLLVQLGRGGWTLAHLAVRLRAPAVVVVRAGLGTLNHTALTLEALGRRHVPNRVVIGEWPAEPTLVHRTNLADLPGELGGVVPGGVGGWPGTRFRAAAAGWLAPELYGHLDVATLRTEQSR
jgi:dethiobiotin synthetase